MPMSPREVRNLRIRPEMERVISDCRENNNHEYANQEQDRLDTFNRQHPDD